MRRLSDTIARFQAAARHTVAEMPSMAMPGAGGASRLTPFAFAGANPGALAAFAFVPPGTGPMPLVVVLHGCTQSAAAYDHAAGWSALAVRHGFAVLFPQQARENNPNLCFNWFQPDDARRGAGEVESIRQMVAALIATRPINAARVYVTGLSAGGAMAGAMLACHPELFAGGGIIAGLPYGTAHNVSQALDRMRGHGLPGEEGAALVRAASPHRGRWPTLSVWHGTADTTVVPAAAEAIVAQWRPLHGARTAPDRVERVDGQDRRVWLDADGQEAIEAWQIAGLGHGTPLATRASADEHAGAHMLEAGISSTRHLARRWGLLTVAEASADAAPTPAMPDSPAAVIEAALRMAGLRR